MDHKYSEKSNSRDLEQFITKQIVIMFFIFMKIENA